MTDPPDYLLELYELTRQHMNAEAAHIATRVSWLLTANSFLMAPYAIAAGQEGVAERALSHRLLGGITALGFLSCAITLGLVTAAISVSHDLVNGFQREVEEEAKNADVTKRTKLEKGWATLGGTVPDIRGGSWQHMVGLWLPAVMVVVVAGFWAWLALG